MLIPSLTKVDNTGATSLSRRVNANSQHYGYRPVHESKLIKKGEC